MPRVSVVLPAYNRAALLPRSIASVLGQTFRDLELIVVDDGSTDGTEGVVRAFGDPRVSYLRHDRNRGPSAARNTGIKAARGAFAAFQDSDDEWLPAKLERQLEAMERAPAEVGVVYSRFWRQDGGRRTLIPPEGFAPPPDGDVRRALLKENFVGMPVALAKAECFADGGLFDESLPMFEDWELWLRLSKRWRFLFLPDPLVVTYRTAAGVNDQGRLRRVAACERIIAAHREDFLAEPRILAGHYRHLGKTLFLAGRVTEGLGCLGKALRLSLAGSRA